MIVGFDLEGASPAVADVDDAGVVPWPLHHQLAARRQPLQMHARGFVGTMLAPHHAEDAQLGQGGFASQCALDALILFRSDSMIGDDFRSDYFSMRCGHRRLTLLSHDQLSPVQRVESTECPPHPPAPLPLTDSLQFIGMTA